MNFILLLQLILNLLLFSTLRKLHISKELIPYQTQFYPQINLQPYLDSDRQYHNYSSN